MTTGPDAPDLRNTPVARGLTLDMDAARATTRADATTHDEPKEPAHVHGTMRAV